jgi:hypothetical protein
VEFELELEPELDEELLVETGVVTNELLTVPINDSKAARNMIVTCGPKVKPAGGPLSTIPPVQLRVNPSGVQEHPEARS